MFHLFKMQNIIVSVYDANLNNDDCSMFLYTNVCSTDDEFYDEHELIMFCFSLCPI